MSEPIDLPVVFEITRIARRFYTWHFERDGIVRIGYGNRAAAIDAADRWINRRGGSDGG